MPSLFLKVCNVGILYLLVICSIQLKLRNTKFYGVRIMNRNTLLLHVKLEALGERRPPWPRQIITPILPNVKVLSLG